MSAPSLSSVHFGVNEKTARVVQRHPRLIRQLPAEIDELVTGFHGAKALADAVKAVKVETVDFQSVLDVDLRAGRQPDALKLIDDFAASDRRAREVRAVTEHLAALPVYYVNEIVRVIDDEVPTMPDVLADELDELLDRAAEVVATLDGIDSAEAAVDAEKADDWKALKALAVEYAELREAQLALGRLDPLNMTPGSVGVALVTFGGIERVVPDLARRLTGQVRNTITGDAITALPFPLFDFAAPAHLLAVVRNRAVLQPHVARPSEVGDRLAAVYAEGEPAGAQPDRTRSDQLGGEHAAIQAISRRARNAPPAPLGDPMAFDGVVVGHRRRR